MPAAKSFARLTDPAAWDAEWAAEAALVASALIDADLLNDAVVASIEGGSWPQTVQVAINTAAVRRQLRRQAYDVASTSALAGVGALAAAEPLAHTAVRPVALAQEKQGRDAGPFNEIWRLLMIRQPINWRITCWGASILGQFPDLPLQDLTTGEATSVAAVLASRPTVVVVGATWHEPSLLFAEAVRDILRIRRRTF